MKSFAVATINFFDNDLRIFLVEDESWKKALGQVEDLTDYNLPDDIEEAKTEAFNSDWLFDVEELPGKED